MARYCMLTYRKATPDDAGTIIAILDEVAAWLETRGIFQWRPGEFAQNVQDGIEQGEVYLAFQAGVAVGTFRLQSSDPRIWGDADANALYVHRLAVSRSVAGQGIGVAILREAERLAMAAEREYLRLDCWGDNPSLVAYYEQAGFTLVRETPFGSWNCALLERRVSDSMLPHNEPGRATGSKG